MPVTAGKIKKIPLDTGEQAFAYAKACGIIGKSFVGKRIPVLVKINSLNELDRLVFPETRHELPGRELLIDLEKRIINRTVSHIYKVLDSYSRPSQLLIRQFRSYEYVDLKTCLHNICAGRTVPPLNNIGRFGTVHFERYPVLETMLAGTEYEFILKHDIGTMHRETYDLAPLETELDLHYYSMLLHSLNSLSASNRMFAERILADEISLRNCVWALRLRTYFDKKPEETAKFLMDLRIPKNRKSLAADAVKSLDFSLDSRTDWKRWRWENFLNPETDNWIADPRYFQNAASRYLYGMAFRFFRRMPFSVSSIFCYIKLKQFEEDLLTSIAEGLGLGMGSTDVFDLLEVTA